MTQTCPTSKDLRSVVDGSLSDIEAQSMELHIERCEACQHAIQELAADGAFWKSAVKNLSDDKIVGPGLDRVIETLQHQSREDAEEIGEAIELKLSFIEPPVEPGTIGRLRHYDLLRVAGRGGMGIVLKAFDRSLRRIVAIKLLAPHLAGNGQARQRFIREGRAAAAICHEHVVTIHAVEESPPFLVMQYVHGETLESRIHRNGSLDVREAVRIALQIAQGLAAAHAQGVVHRDIKPANILLENGVARVRITDFGLARAVDDASLTQSGVVAGTPQYMAPEQANGDAIDERADLFSLGSVLYTMLAGHAPFRATTAMGVLKRLCDNAARPIREINPETPDWLVVLINRLHAKRPADRFHHAGEVAALLERGLAAMQSGATQASGWASALRVSAVPEDSQPGENISTQNPSGGRGWTERSEGSPGVSGWRPPTPATHQSHSHSSFIFTDLGAVLKQALPPYPLWLLFAGVGLAVTPFVWQAGILGGAFAVIALLAPRVMPRMTSKLLHDSASPPADPVNASADSAALIARKSFLSVGVPRLLGWSALWILPAIVWKFAFFSLEFKALSGMSNELSAVTDEFIGMMAVIFMAWLVIAFFWFRQKQKGGSPLFSSVVRRKGMFTVVGLAAIFGACGYGTWYSDVYRHRLQQIAWANPKTSVGPLIPQQQLFPVRIEFEGAQEGIDVVIDNGSDPVAWAPIGNSRQTSLPGSPGTFPWHARLGQNTFASGEVTLEAGKTAVIRVPRPKLIDLIAGRWKSEKLDPAMAMAVGESSDIINLEFEFSKETAIIANRTPDSTSRSDLTVQIDESVTPALVTLTGSSDEKLVGIIRFEPHAVDFGLQSGSMGMDTNAGMDRLRICITAGGSLRPWQFASDPDRGTMLFELIRSENPEPLRHSLVLEPLPNETTASVVKETVEAWAKHLNVPIERRNTIGLDLTLVPPTNVELPPDRIVREKRLVLPEGMQVVNDPSNPPLPPLHSAPPAPPAQPDPPDRPSQPEPPSQPSQPEPPGQPSQPEPKAIVSYPFVISRDVISMSQFQQFVADTGYVTDAESGQPLTAAQLPSETALPTERVPETDSDVPVEGATTAQPAGTIGGWLLEEGKLVWHNGVSWKRPTLINGSSFPASSGSPLPVVMLSHNDAIAFCQWLSDKENRQYRLPTAHEWTAAIQLGAVRLRFDSDQNEPYRTWFDASQANALGIRNATEISGEWTSNSEWHLSKSVTVIVTKDISSDGKRFDLSHQWLAPPTFRSSEISFRVVAELQTLTTPVDSPKQ